MLTVCVYNEVKLCSYCCTCFAVVCSGEEEESSQDVVSTFFNTAEKYQDGVTREEEYGVNSSLQTRKCVLDSLVHTLYLTVCSVSTVCVWAV